ncbi:hypothetical protein GUJ93_ZPchr0010g8883 [Zizania palustris]|uniref:Uncharacterized protein n=1 Tax=Zizania palustris TaxID=103762 RepID=A0A8J5WBN6_ZIZPA|nr:hypothetical protein GUJ93_ZPchr0010g8883 [Zizania palustris]
MPGDVATSPAPAPPSASSPQSHHATSARGLLCHAVAGASAGNVALEFISSFGLQPSDYLNDRRIWGLCAGVVAATFVCRSM